MSSVYTTRCTVARKFVAAMFVLLGACAIGQGLAAAEGSGQPGAASTPLPPAAAQRPPVGAVYHITLVTDNTPDLTDIDSYLRSITSQYDTPQQKAIAIWRWSQRLRKQTTNPIEDGHFVLDPIELFNSYGYCNCGIISGVNNALWLRMGWQARYIQLGDHTVSECSWDGGRWWHMFDASMSIYCFNDRGEVASVEEIEKNPRFYLENFAPECGTNPVSGPDDHRGWRCAADRPVENRRTLANGYDSFKPPNSIDRYCLYAEWGRRYVLNLRADESYTRYWRPLPGGGAGTFRPVRGNEDVDQRIGNIRGNGVWVYRPNLTDPRTRQLVYSTSGTDWTHQGVKGPGQVIFKVAAANVVTSAVIRAKGRGITLSVSRDVGINWQPVELKSGQAQCIDQVAGTTEYLVKVELADADALLSALTLETITQLNRHAIPSLRRGPNRVQLRLGPQVETVQFRPSVVGGNHRRTVFAEQLVDVEKEPGRYKPTLRPAENGKPCYVTWKIETPTPIIDLLYGGSVCVRGQSDRVALLHSWDDRRYVKDYEKTDPAPPWDLMVHSAVTNVPPNTATAYLRYEFQTARAARSYGGPGIQMATMTVHHQPRAACFVPIEVTFCWIEHRPDGDVERRHTELVPSSAHEYTINVGGYRDPTMKWLRINLKGSNPEGPEVKYGYSDGQDVGPGAKPPWELYRWGKNLALGCKYILQAQQDRRNPDAGGDLTDGIIAPPDTYVSEKWMPTYVMFAKESPAVATIDLGAVRRVQAVRVHAGQDAGFRLTFPESIVVELSSDGSRFSRADAAQFDQVFHPPADYVPWELDQSAFFDELPAGGRLAYAYRVILDRPAEARYVRISCRPRSGWGMVLSEVQVFDAVQIDRNPPPPVMLPAIDGPTR